MRWVAYTALALALLATLAAQAAAATVVFYLFPSATSSAVYKPLPPGFRVETEAFPVYIPGAHAVAYIRFVRNPTGPGYYALLPGYDTEHRCIRAAVGWTRVLAVYTLEAGEGLDPGWYALVEKYLNVTFPGCPVDPLVLWWALHGEPPGRHPRRVNITVVASAPWGERLSTDFAKTLVAYGRSGVNSLPELPPGVYECTEGLKPARGEPRGYAEIRVGRVTVRIGKGFGEPPSYIVAVYTPTGRLVAASRAEAPRVYCANGTLVLWVGALAVAVNPPRDTNKDGIPDALEHLACVRVSARGDFAAAYWIAATNATAVEELPESLRPAVLAGTPPKPVVARLSDALASIEARVPAPLPYGAAAILAASKGRYNYVPYTACEALERLTSDEPGARATLAHYAVENRDCRALDAAIAGTIYDVYEALAGLCGDEGLAYAAGVSLLHRAGCSSDAVAAVERVAPRAVADACGHTTTTTVTRVVTRTVTVTVMESAGPASSEAGNTTVPPGEALVAAAVANGVAAAYIARMFRVRGRRA